jgi:hypothetical protein
LRATFEVALLMTGTAPVWLIGFMQLKSRSNRLCHADTTPGAYCFIRISIIAPQRALRAFPAPASDHASARCAQRNQAAWAERGC